MTAVGRPKIGDRVSIRLPAGVLAEIDGRAAAAGVSRAEAIRLLLGRALSVGADDGVDRAQIERRLRMTPAERVRATGADGRAILALTRRAT